MAAMKANGANAENADTDKQNLEPAEDEKEQKQNERPFNLDDLKFNVSPKEMEAIKKVYSEQCPSMAHSAQQSDLWRLLAVARKNHIPLLPWLIDAFTRDRLAFSLKAIRLKRQNGTLSLQQWVTDYPVLKSLSKQKKVREMIQAAVQTFFARYTSAINLPVQEKTDDSIESFTSHIAEATSFIQTLIDQDHVNPPFQVDLMIIPKKVVNASNMHSEEDDDPSDDDFDDDDDEDSDEDEDDAKEDPYAPYADIPNIKERLEKDSERVFVHHVLKGGFRPRSYHEVHRELKEKLGAGKGTHGFKEPTKEMPNGRRVCFVADRRCPIEELFVYKGCEGTGDLPRQHVPEWYYQSSFLSVIPGVDAMKVGSRITAKTSAEGYVFVMSFQVEARDCIKAYLYTRGTMIRFLPQDIDTLLPELFVDSEPNQKFIKEWRANAEENMAKIKLADPQYDRFIKAAKATK